MAKITFKNLPDTTTPLNADNLNQITNHILGILGLDVDTWNSSTSYVVDDVVLYESELYACISATSGAWNASKWEKITVFVNE